MWRKGFSGKMLPFKTEKSQLYLCAERVACITIANITLISHLPPPHSLSTFCME
jgi:hypothetical protein